MNTQTSVSDPAALREEIQAKYGAAARSVRQGQGEAACCGGSCGCGGRDPITVNLYDEAQTAGLPAEAVLASLGCGNPTMLASLEPGEVVLDLGSGGGIDVLLSAKRVGPTGKAYGLDMTDDMLTLARENQLKREYIDRLSQSEADQEIEIRRRLKLVKPNEKVFMKRPGE